MSHLTLELPDETVQTIAATAAKLGLTAEQWAARRLRLLALTPEQRRAEKEKILRHAGSCESIGDLSNEAIDQDLAEEYAANHEEP